MCISPSVRLEFRVAQIAPKDRRHPELVRVGKRLGNLGDLPRRFVRAKIDRRADRDRAHIVRLLDRAEHHLVEFVRIGQQLVVIDFHDERDLVRVFAGDRAQHAKGRGHGVAAALDGELDDIFGVEILRIRRKDAPAECSMP